LSAALGRLTSASLRKHWVSERRTGRWRSGLGDWRSNARRGDRRDRQPPL